MPSSGPARSVPAALGQSPGQPSHTSPASPGATNLCENRKSRQKANMLHPELVCSPRITGLPPATSDQGGRGSFLSPSCPTPPAHHTVECTCFWLAYLSLWHFRAKANQQALCPLPALTASDNSRLLCRLWVVREGRRGWRLRSLGAKEGQLPRQAHCEGTMMDMARSQQV